MLDHIEVSEALSAAVPPAAIRRAIRRYLAGNWGRCGESDRSDHAFRGDSVLLVACYRHRGLRFHLVTNADRSLNRLQLASE